MTRYDVRKAARNRKTIERGTGARFDRKKNWSTIVVGFPSLVGKGV